MLKSKPLAFDLPESFPLLACPPVVEATVVLSARPQRWNATVREELTRDVGQCDFEPARASLEVADQQEQAVSPGLLVAREDPRLILHLGPQGMQISHLSPYTSWDTLTKHLLEAWTSFALRVEPVSIDRVEVRFVNRVRFNGWEELRRACPAAYAIPEDVLSAAKCHTSLTELAIQEADYSLRVLLHVRTGDERLQLLLMPEVHCSAQLPVDDRKRLEHVLERMRYLKNKAFFTWFSQEAVARFGKQRP